MSLTLDEFKKSINQTTFYTTYYQSYPSRLSNDEETIQYNKTMQTLFTNCLANLNTTDTNQGRKKITITNDHPTPVRLWAAGAIISKICEMNVSAGLLKTIGLKVHNSFEKAIEDISRKDDGTYHPINEYFIQNNLPQFKEALTNETMTILWPIDNPLIYPEIQVKPIPIDPKKNDQWNLALAKKYTDAILKVGDKEFPVHKIILTANSAYFKAFFESGLKESNGNGPIEFTFPDLSPDIFEMILKFIYTQSIDLAKTDNLYVLTNFAQSAEMNDLRTACEQEYRRRLSSKTFLEILADTSALKNETLKAHCQLFMKIYPTWSSLHMKPATYSIMELNNLHTAALFIGAQELLKTLKAVITKRITKESFPELCAHIHQLKNKPLTEIYSKFFDKNKYEATKEMKLAYIRLTTGFDSEELEELVTLERPNKKQKL